MLVLGLSFLSLLQNIYLLTNQSLNFFFFFYVSLLLFQTHKASSGQLGSIFARCTMCKNILDTWSFSSDQGIVCYSCKPSDEECKEEVESTIGVDSKEPGNCIEDSKYVLYFYKLTKTNLNK